MIFVAALAVAILAAILFTRSLDNARTGLFASSIVALAIAVGLLEFAVILN